MSKKLIAILITIGAIIAIALMMFAFVFTTQNKAINLEEQVKESKSSINIQEKRRGDLIVNLVDTVQEYDKHEKSTLVELTEARKNAKSDNEENVEDAKIAIEAVAEAYPDLKSVENYQKLMTELSVTENLIAEHRNNFNVQVKAYSKHLRIFPNHIFLGILGYEKIDATYLEYETEEDSPKDLFKKDDD